MSVILLVSVLHSFSIILSIAFSLFCTFEQLNLTFIYKFMCFLDPSQHADIKREPESIISFYRGNSGSVQDVLNLSSSLNSSRDNSDPPAQQPANPAANVNQDVGHDDEDCVIVSEYLPPPSDSTNDGLIKQKNDPISNDFPFMLTVWHILTLYSKYK